MHSKSIRVEILGHEYPLRVSDENEAFMRQVAAYVDARLQQVQRDVSGVSDTTYAVLGALAIAEELHLVRSELQRLHTAVDTDAEALAARLEAALDAGA